MKKYNKIFKYLPLMLLSNMLISNTESIGSTYPHNTTSQVRLYLLKGLDSLTLCDLELQKEFSPEVQDLKSKIKSNERRQNKEKRDINEAELYKLRNDVEKMVRRILEKLKLVPSSGSRLEHVNDPTCQQNNLESNKEKIVDLKSLHKNKIRTQKSLHKNKIRTQKSLHKNKIRTLEELLNKLREIKPRVGTFLGFEKSKLEHDLKKYIEEQLKIKPGQSSSIDEQIKEFTKKIDDLSINVTYRKLPLTTT